jgi:hypothetical protein
MVLPILFFMKGGAFMHLFGITFGEGNSKVGDVFTFSLPSIISCPGKSHWCNKHCNMSKFEKFRPTCLKAYKQNFTITNQTEKFTETVIGTLPRILPAFRIHVSGDFYSKNYIKSWIRICNSFSQTKFWAYTRSWAIPELKPSLETLRNLPNVELFASTDPTMSHPPENWRIAFLNTDPRAIGIQCHHQENKLKSCLTCGFCFKANKENVIFKVH